jgi:hypothetical protein
MGVGWANLLFVFFCLGVARSRQENKVSDKRPNVSQFIFAIDTVKTGVGMLIYISSNLFWESSGVGSLMCHPQKMIWQLFTPERQQIKNGSRHPNCELRLFFQELAGVAITNLVLCEFF